MTTTDRASPRGAPTTPAPNVGIGTKLFAADTALVGCGAWVPEGNAAIALGGQLWNQLCRTKACAWGARKGDFAGRRGPHRRRRARAHRSRRGSLLGPMLFGADRHRGWSSRTSPGRAAS